MEGISHKTDRRNGRAYDAAAPLRLATLRPEGTTHVKSYRISHTLDICRDTCCF
jgi:hypothetical protein